MADNFSRALPWGFGRLMPALRQQKWSFYLPYPLVPVSRQPHDQGYSAARRTVLLVAALNFRAKIDHCALWTAGKRRMKRKRRSNLAIKRRACVHLSRAFFFSSTTTINLQIGRAWFASLEGSCCIPLHQLAFVVPLETPHNRSRATGTEITVL